MAMPIAALDVALTARAAGAATIDVPALVASPASPPDATIGFDTGVAVSTTVTVSASGSWCTHAAAPTICNGPDGNPSWGAPNSNFLITTPSTIAFALVGRIGTTGAWTLVGSGPVTLSGSGNLYLAQNDERGQFVDNGGSLTAEVTLPTPPPPPPPAAKLAMPAANPPVSSTITTGERAAWTVPISNTGGSTLTGLTATLSAASGATPLPFDESLMPGCAPAGNTEVCSLADLPPGATRAFDVYVNADAVANGKIITGGIRASATGQTDVVGSLGNVTVASCGESCVVGIGAPGAPVESIAGPPTDDTPTKQIVSFPGNPLGSPPVAITLKSIDPGPKLSDADRLLCPATGNTCSGQISVVGGDFSKYTDKAHPVRIQIIAKWKNKVPPGRILMAKPGHPPVQLATCEKHFGFYNTPCQLPEVVKGSAAAHNLMTITTILFIAADPRMARHVVTGPDAPLSVKATAGKKTATVTWKAPIVTNGRIVKYSVTPHLGKAAKPAVAVVGNLLKATVKGLQSGKSYTFTVVAKTAVGISLSSKASNAVKIK